MNATVPPLPEAEITPLIRARLPHVQAVLLYGSFARGEAWPGSDVDLAVLAAAPIEPVLLFDLKGDLEALLRRDVDLVDLRRIGSDLSMEIVQRGRALWQTDEDSLTEWELHRLAESARLGHERADLLADFRAGIGVNVRTLQ